MKGVVFYGVEGEQYRTLQEAWHSYMNHGVGGKTMSGDEYRSQHLAFMAGALGSMNVLSVKLSASQDAKMSDTAKFVHALVATIEEAVKETVNAMAEKKGGGKAGEKNRGN